MFVQLAIWQALLVYQFSHLSILCDKNFDIGHHVQTFKKNLYTYHVYRYCWSPPFFASFRDFVLFLRQPFKSKAFLYVGALGAWIVRTLPCNAWVQGFKFLLSQHFQTWALLYKSHLDCNCQLENCWQLFLPLVQCRIIANSYPVVGLVAWIVWTLHCSAWVQEFKFLLSQHFQTWALLHKNQLDGSCQLENCWQLFLPIIANSYPVVDLVAWIVWTLLYNAWIQGSKFRLSEHFQTWALLHKNQLDGSYQLEGFWQPFLSVVQCSILANSYPVVGSHASCLSFVYDCVQHCEGTAGVELSYE